MGNRNNEKPVLVKDTILNKQRTYSTGIEAAHALRVHKTRISGCAKDGSLIRQRYSVTFKEV